MKSLIRKAFNLLFMPNVNAVYLCYLALFLQKKRRRFLAIIVRNRLVNKYGIHLGLNCKIGKGLLLPHPHGIVIGDGVIIGENCIVYHNVTFGKRDGIEPTSGYPHIGNNIIIYPGTVVIGEISINDDSVIGANSTVTKNVEKNSVIVGKW